MNRTWHILVGLSNLVTFPLHILWHLVHFTWTQREVPRPWIFVTEGFKALVLSHWFPEWYERMIQRMHMRAMLESLSKMAGQISQAFAAGNVAEVKGLIGGIPEGLREEIMTLGHKIQGARSIEEKPNVGRFHEGAPSLKPVVRRVMVVGSAANKLDLKSLSEDDCTGRCVGCDSCDDLMNKKGGSHGTIH